MNLPEIPRSWLIMAILLAMVILRAYGIDTWTTAALGLVVGYIVGQHYPEDKNEVEQS